METLKVYEQIEKEAQEKNVHENRTVKAFEVGKVIRQGDVYLHMVAPDHAHGPETQNRQLALGSSNGSRHMALAPAKIYEGTTAPSWCGRVFLGPLVQSDKPFVVAHPEHASVECPAGTYQVSLQMDARTLQRVQD